MEERCRPVFQNTALSRGRARSLPPGLRRAAHRNGIWTAKRDRYVNGIGACIFGPGSEDSGQIDHRDSSSAWERSGKLITAYVLLNPFLNSSILTFIHFCTSRQVSGLPELAQVLPWVKTLFFSKWLSGENSFVRISGFHGLEENNTE